MDYSWPCVHLKFILFAAFYRLAEELDLQFLLVKYIDRT